MNYSKETIFLFCTLLTIVHFSAHATDLKVHFGICEQGSNCDRCIDSYEYTLIPDVGSRRVVAIGFDKGGKAVWREYNGCQMEDANNWRCTGFHGDYVSRKSTVTLESNARTYYPQRGLEICNFDE